MSRLKLRHPVLIFASLYFLLGHDRTGMLRIGLLSSLLHECGHILAWIIQNKSLPELELSWFGITLRRSNHATNTPKQELVLAMAGPTVNFMLAALTCELMQHGATLWGYRFASANILVGGFNLLPLWELDGKYLWHFIREKLQLFRR